MSAAIAVGVSQFCGDSYALMVAVIVLMVLDYVSGIICAIVNKSLDSRVGIRGIVKKFGYLLIIAVACTVDITVMADKQLLRPLILTFFISNESISILENLGKIGIPLPEKFIQILEQLGKGNKNENG